MTDIVSSILDMIVVLISVGSNLILYKKLHEGTELKLDDYINIPKENTAYICCVIVTLPLYLYRTAIDLLSIFYKNPDSGKLVFVASRNVGRNLLQADLVFCYCLILSNTFNTEHSRTVDLTVIFVCSQGLYIIGNLASLYTKHPGYNYPGSIFICSSCCYVVGFYTIKISYPKT
jgi:hypothetical protein